MHAPHDARSSSLGGKYSYLGISVSALYVVFADGEMRKGFSLEIMSKFSTASCARRVPGRRLSGCNKAHCIENGNKA